MAYWRKTKEERRVWWNGLTSEQQAAQLEKWQGKKADKRRAKSIKLMAKKPNEFACSDCFHQKSQSCTDELPNGCEHFFGAEGQKLGPAYTKQKGKVKKQTKAAKRKEKADKLWAEQTTKKGKVIVLPDAGQKNLQRYNLGVYAY